MNHRGYGRWTLLNQVVKENHPQSLSLMDIVKNKNSNPAASDDEIYGMLKSHFSDNFLMLNQQEEV